MSVLITDRDMARSRSQVLFRFRPNQTFDHVAGYTAQVRAYGRDDAFDAARLDPDYLIEEAMAFVHRWRVEGRGSGGQTVDRAPEFPEDDPTARNHYEVVVPGRVFARIWPSTVRCARSIECGRVWESDITDPNGWPPSCPRCRNRQGNRQLQYLFVHDCGEARPMMPRDQCPRGHRSGFRLNDRSSRFQDFRWECIECRLQQPVRAFCRATCPYPDKMMSPQVHTASSAYVGHGKTVVNTPSRDFAQRSRTPGFVVGTIGLWLGVCTEREASQLQRAARPADVPKEVLESIKAMEDAGLTEQASALRRRFMPADLEIVRGRITDVLGFDPLGDDQRGGGLAANLELFQRVRALPRLTIEDLDGFAANASRASRYAEYRGVLRGAGLDPDGCMLVNDFPITYLAIGYSRGGFNPAEADLVAYRGRAGRGMPVTTLLYAAPVETEALVFVLDPNQVTRWLVANHVATPRELEQAGGAKRWFAAQLDPRDGQLPSWDPDREPQAGDASFGAQAVFSLLHSMSHQILRGLAVDSGYSETSLSEYLFPYDFAFAIHPNGGEFTIGGLRTVLEQNLDEVLGRALDNSTCIYDPNCMIANRGSDHGCMHLPETACHTWNRFLSRWHLFGSPEGDWIGYWDQRVRLDESRT